MSAEIISLADRRRAKVQHGGKQSLVIPSSLTKEQLREAHRLGLNPAGLEARARKEGCDPSEILLTFQLLDRIESNLGIKGKPSPFTVTRTDPRGRRPS